MPVDSFNVKKIYPDSTRNPMSWSASSVTDTRAQLSGTLDSVTKNGDVFTFTGNSAARYNIFTTVGYVATDINANHAQIKARGYMQNPKDWRDLEMTAYVRLTGEGSDDQFVMYCRGGKHEGDGSCEGFAYKADLYFSGPVRVAKEQWHVSYEFTDDQPAMGSIEGKWVGMKSIFYNNAANTEVTIEIWLDKNADGNWIKVFTYVDRGGFGSEGALCGGTPDMIGTWAGPVATYRWDNVNTIDLKWMSVREINPFGAFTDGGSDPTGGTQTGGQGGTGTGTNPTGGQIVCVDNPIVVTPGTGGGLVAGDCTKTLYKKTGRTQNFVDEGYGVRHYSSGKPDDVTREHNAESCPYDSYEITMYVTIANPDNNEDTISVKMYGPHHEDGQGAWYILDLVFNTGQFCSKIEQPHPDTSPSCEETGISIGSIIDKKIGYKIVIWKVGSGAMVVGYADTGNGLWKEGFRQLNIAGEQFSRDPDQQVQVRIDACPHITMHCISLVEITAGGEFVGSGASEGTTTGGGQTCTFIPDDTTPTDPNPSGSGGGNQNEPKPLVTMSKDWTFITNSGVEVDDLCTAGNPLEPRTYVPVPYNIAGETGIYRDLGYTAIYSEGTTELGIYVNTVQSILYDKILRKIVVNGIKRTVDVLGNSCTGTLTCLLANFTEMKVRKIFGDPVNVAGIDTVEQSLTFTQDDNTYPLKVGDMILLQYSSPSTANVNKCLKVKATTKDTYDSINSYLIVRLYGGYVGVWDRDVAFGLFT